MNALIEWFQEQSYYFFELICKCKFSFHFIKMELGE